MLGLMLIYIASIVLVSIKGGFWNSGLIKDTIYWTFGVAFIMLMQVGKNSSDTSYFNKAVTDNFKLILLLEFVVNLHTFSLIIELIAVPVIAMTVMTMTYAECYSDEKPEYKRIYSFLAKILAAYVFIVAAISVYNIVTNFQNFATQSTLRNFLLPPLFSTAFLPFLYLIALLMKYETTFIRIEINNDDAELARHIKRRTLQLCHVSLKKLNAWSQETDLFSIRTKRELVVLIKKFNSTSNNK